MSEVAIPPSCTRPAFVVHCSNSHKPKELAVVEEAVCVESKISILTKEEAQAQRIALTRRMHCA